MDKIGQKIRTLRKNVKMPLRKLAAQLDIDASTLSKIERGERKTNKAMLQNISQIFEVNYDQLLIDFLSDEICQRLQNEINSDVILKIATQKIQDLKNNN